MSPLVLAIQELALHLPGDFLCPAFSLLDTALCLLLEAQGGLYPLSPGTALAGLDVLCGEKMEAACGKNQIFFLKNIYWFVYLTSSEPVNVSGHPLSSVTAATPAHV